MVRHTAHRATAYRWMRHDGPPDTQAAVAAAYHALVVAIRSRVPHSEQLAQADVYIAAIKAHAKATDRKLPVPNRFAILRQLG